MLSLNINGALPQKRFWLALAALILGIANSSYGADVANDPAASDVHLNGRPTTDKFVAAPRRNKCVAVYFETYNIDVDCDRYGDGLVNIDALPGYIVRDLDLLANLGNELLASSVFERIVRLQELKLIADDDYEPIIWDTKALEIEALSLVAASEIRRFKTAATDIAMNLAAAKFFRDRALGQSSGRPDDPAFITDPLIEAKAAARIFWGEAFKAPFPYEDYGDQPTETGTAAKSGS